MNKKIKLASIVLDNFFEGFTLDANNKLKVVNEESANRSSEALAQLVLEQSRELWEKLEMAESSMSDVADEISFQELNTDSSSLGMDVDAGDSDASPESNEVLPESLDSMFGAEEFNFESIFENFDETLMDDEGEEDIVDGDEEFEDLQMGMDDDNMGEVDPVRDDAGDMDSIGDDSDTDDFDADEESLDDDFDFDFLNDENDVDGDVEADMDSVDDMDDFEGAEISMDDEDEIVA